MVSTEHAANGIVIAVARRAVHRFVKEQAESVALLYGLGVEGDAHAGPIVRHRYSARKHPGVPNLRQVHLLEAEALDALAAAGFHLEAGALGENILVRGVGLTKLAKGTRLALGPEAVVEATGLREPCSQIDKYRRGLRAVCTVSSGEGSYVRGGLMATVVSGGLVRPGDVVGVRGDTSALPLPIL